MISMKDYVAPSAVQTSIAKFISLIWPVAVALIMGSVAWGSFTGELTAHQDTLYQLRKSVIDHKLVPHHHGAAERLARIEEAQKFIIANQAEMRADIKDIASHLRTWNDE